MDVSTAGGYWCFAGVDFALCGLDLFISLAAVPAEEVLRRPAKSRIKG